ncbi:pyridoxamine 5'-phosphate oxidase family protein, partial [Methanobrevibacter sp.]|uniref:pyridoxamine 5'-phosphate oxidase family protein n=1 Tax=Methanobrevibacter sp. TaxID=66852 RepID=UPI003890976A
MFRNMRRAGQELSKEECEEILISQPRGILALLGDYDYPYTVPMNHVYVDGKLYFHGAKTGHKNDAIRNHSKCSYCVLNEGVKAENSWWYTFKSVVLFGNIKTISDEARKVEILTVLGDKFFPTHEETVDEIDRL